MMQQLYKSVHVAQDTHKLQKHKYMAFVLDGKKLHSLHLFGAKSSRNYVSYSTHNKNPFKDKNLPSIIFTIKDSICHWCSSQSLEVIYIGFSPIFFITRCWSIGRSISNNELYIFLRRMVEVFWKPDSKNWLHLGRYNKCQICIKVWIL